MNSVHREELIRALPYIRRYARALTGTQAGGDQLVAASLQAVLRRQPSAPDPRIALYREATRQFSLEREASPRDITAPLTLQQRQLMLLVSLEELPIEKAAEIVGVGAGRG